MTANKKKKTAKGKAKGPSPFWKPSNVGDQIEGKFLSFQETKLGGAMQLDTGLLPLRTTIKQALREVYKTMKPGDKVTVVYEGMNKRTQIYSVFLNGKKVEGKSSFAPVEKKNLPGLFED